MPKSSSVSAADHPHRQRTETGSGGPSFPIVGIGCSAGGLQALKEFFSRVPPACGIAFVIVQHLDPHHSSSLVELIQRCTVLPVREIADHTEVEANAVYVIPPNKDLSLLHNTLNLLDLPSPAARHLPIDFFLRSLAEDRGDKSIGIILSGMGSDGMLGLRAIKEQNGLTLAQEPRSAKCDSMPKSVIDAGLADVVAPADELPGRLIDILAHLPTPMPAEGFAAIGIHNALEKIVILLRDRCGTDFSDYKPSTLYRRIERRTALHQLPGFSAYVSFVRDNPQELDLLYKELLIGVTSFFRDPAVWQFLRDQALPKLFSASTSGRSLRAWVPACSSGEEAYSLAIVFMEAVDACKPSGRFTLQIYATDLDADAIDKARKGLFPANIAADVSPERLDRFFVRDDNGYRICKEIRDMIVFAPQNIISDPPFTRLDLLTCRNLLIYLGPSLQKKLLPVFHYALNRDGILALGTAETIGNFTDLFIPLDNTVRVFQKLESPTQANRLDFPFARRSPIELPMDLLASEQRDNLEVQADRYIQQHFAPAAVLVNGEGDILYFSGRTGKYLEPAAGKVNINIHAMARPGLREALTGVIRNAMRQDHPIVLRGLPIGTNGGTKMVDVTVQAIEHPDALQGKVLVVFQDVPVKPAGRRRTRNADQQLSTIELELQQTREALRVTHEEMQTSMEEYKSANEELQSTNEELQSTNEELTTSKEELQSLNEELQTVNAELQHKVEELTGIRNDMTNLLNSTEIATVFLDNEMKLRRFTEHATQLFKLIPGDIGRPLTDIVCELDYPELTDDAREVLRSLVFRQHQATARDGRWFRVRVMPYRTIDNVIDGVVITFIDITEIKMLEAHLQSRESQRPPQ